MKGVSRNTSPVWCAAYARSPPRARAPSVSARSGPPPSGTKQEASDASQSAAGFLQRGRLKFRCKLFFYAKMFSSTLKLPKIKFLFLTHE